LGDELEVSTQIAYARGLRAGRHNEVRLVRDGRLLVEIDSDWVWVDPLRLRPRVVPNEILEAFGITGTAKEAEGST
jgi:acyl-CoA thioester hydrolase